MSKTPSNATLLTLLVAFLALLPTAVLSQAPTDVVVHGRFEAGFTPIPNPDPLDGSSPDDLPNGWQRLETFEGGTEGSVIFRRTDNGPSHRGSSSLGITRTGGGSSGDWTVVRQDLSLNASECSALTLLLDVLVENHKAS